MNDRNIKLAEMEVDAKSPLQTACNYYEALLEPVLEDLEKDVGKNFRAVFIWELCKLISPPKGMEKVIEEFCKHHFPEDAALKAGKKRESETIH